MKHLALLALLLAGCTTPPPVTAASVPTPQPPAITPGAGSFKSPWSWPVAAAPSPEFEAVLASFKTPDDIARWLQVNTVWRDDYDGTMFLAPSQVFEARRAVCTGFARFWVYALARLGIKGEWLAFWAPEGAHAICVFRYQGQYRIASNMYFYSSPDQALGYDRDQAFAAAASEFYGQRWTSWEWWLDTGQRMDRAAVERGTLATTPQAAPAGRNLFTIRR